MGVRDGMLAPRPGCRSSRHSRSHERRVHEAPSRCCTTRSPARPQHRTTPGQLRPVAASSARDAASDRPPFKKRSTDRVEILSMMPLRTASRATSPGVQWLIGRRDDSGSSQAMAMISRICSGLISGGRPLRGASDRISPIRRCTAESGSSSSTARSRSWDSHHRRRHFRTIGRVTDSRSTMASLA